MPVELVDLVHGQNVEHILDLVDSEDVASHVEHKAAICEIGFVADLAGGDLDTCALLGECGHGQHLTQGLECVEDAGGLLGCDLYTRSIDIQAILFIGKRLVLYNVYGMF